MVLIISNNKILKCLLLGCPGHVSSCKWVLLFFSSHRSGRRIRKTRKYDIITTPAERVEMAPLNGENDDEDDSTLFDIKYRFEFSKWYQHLSPCGTKSTWLLILFLFKGPWRCSLHYCKAVLLHAVLTLGFTLPPFLLSFSTQPLPERTTMSCLPAFQHLSWCLRSQKPQDKSCRVTSVFTFLLQVNPTWATPVFPPDNSSGVTNSLATDAACAWLLSVQATALDCENH